MGETANQPYQLSFNAALKVEFQGSRVTSDGGLILVRELDERLGFSDLIASGLSGSSRVDGEGTEGAMSRRRTLVSSRLQNHRWKSWLI